MLLKIPPLHAIEAHFPTNEEGNFVLPKTTMVIWGEDNEKTLPLDRLLEISDHATPGGNYDQVNHVAGGAILILADFFDFCIHYTSPVSIKHLGKPKPKLL